MKDPDMIPPKASSSIGIEDLITRLTGTTEKDRGKLVRYAGAKLTEEHLVKALSKAFDFMYENRPAFGRAGKSVLIYCGFIVALNKLHYADTRAMHRKDAEDHIPTIADLRRSRMAVAKKRKRHGEKKNQLYKHIAEIIEARTSGHSFQNICDWLEMTYKISVSREYVRKEVKKWKP